ncbi:hypothetical protein H1Z61_01845 [Bacillus aquiflavi]|uniref:Sortilin N-terminal domain-containing protein n=1 Tax=Bacillus aquiflavi TaxID=2672567 RepID=A0A6B3VST8_9BACI|nr:hypothetical protein [Bacillus aquiflavi]MBA4535913.1 hypothetical protein [Bacillus aquiflavi]NEY80288.1 hypothetical protein [Bacillus aquiflavi]
MNLNIKFLFILFLITTTSFTAGCSIENKTNKTFTIEKARTKTIDHIHGIGYSGDGDSLIIASPKGIKIFTEGHWLETNQYFHDYMGFQTTKDGFYASGHPEEGSSLRNPLGLVKSTDLGKSLQTLAFYGESDLHFIATSFYDKTIYILNEEPNSKLNTGVYYTENDGRYWKKCEFNGFNSNTFGMMAVHPSIGSTVAIATKNGIYFSIDNGNTFKQLFDSTMVTAIAFSETKLYFSTVENNKIYLKSYDLKTKKIDDISIPSLNDENPITYIAVNVSNPEQIAFSTYNHDVYETNDFKKNWNKLIENGRLK